MRAFKDSIDARHGAGILPVMKHLLMILVAFSLCLPVAAQDKGKPLPKDFKSLKALAEKGDAKAQYDLGLRFYDGIGVEKDFKEAVKWFRKAAEQGHAEAQYNLGASYHHGDGVIQDHKEAVKWYRLAVEQGDADAQLILGVMHFRGEGVPRDNVQAYAWTHIAEANGVQGGVLIKSSIMKKMTPAQIFMAKNLARKMTSKNPKLIDPR